MNKSENIQSSQNLNNTYRKRIQFQGFVQGVGFRPFIYSLATANKLSGFVQNTSQGVVAEIEGSASDIQNFEHSLQDELPPLASISETREQEVELKGERDFFIVQSEDQGEKTSYISPDMATCEKCLQELFDPADRRYLYPFINCTNCGPRLTIIHSLPYDRSNTSMSEFPLCSSCEREYLDPADRRFHAEPNACPECGPKLQLVDGNGREMPCNDPVQETIRLLKQGYIAAVKGLGGFHLCADPTNPEAVQDLRKRKNREVKPLAIMVDSLQTAKTVAEIGPGEEEVLQSLQRPIVLARKKSEQHPCKEIAPNLPNLGIMLPYTPLHHLLLAGDLKMLIMTSGNRTDEPICIKNQEALSRLSDIADFYLLHNREILVRCDDSIAFSREGEPQLLRRSRGYVPRPTVLDTDYPDVLALGPELKSTLGILKGREMFLSPHIGDLHTSLARDFMQENIGLVKEITRTDPDIIASDMHPDYFSTRFAHDYKAATKIRVQHHHAHIVSCMAENHLKGELLGLAMDGTGYGEDGRIWGGEVLLADRASYERAAHIGYFSLPGGEQAVKYPWRIAASLLRQTFGDDWEEIARSLDIVPWETDVSNFRSLMQSSNFSPYTSSCGRLFDAVAVLLGCSRQVHFEGQAAMELENLASESGSRDILPYRLLQEETLKMDFIPAIQAIVEKRQKGVPVRDLAASFHRTLVDAFLHISEGIRKDRGLNRVALSGGCFQNQILQSLCISGLEGRGFQVYTQTLVPVNDGGIALGQAVCAAERA
ncbi:MAG: carbamoyltransferase HypF [Thermodesulfobacteriota bacterium]